MFHVFDGVVVGGVFIDISLSVSLHFFFSSIADSLYLGFLGCCFGFLAFNPHFVSSVLVIAFFYLRGVSQ